MRKFSLKNDTLHVATSTQCVLLIDYFTACKAGFIEKRRLHGGNYMEVQIRTRIHIKRLDLFKYLFTFCPYKGSGCKATVFPDAGCLISR